MEMKVDVAFHEELTHTAVQQLNPMKATWLVVDFTKTFCALYCWRAVRRLCLGVTKTRVMTASLNFEDHTDRRIAAREAGRFFAGEAVDDNEELLFIGATTIGVDKEEHRCCRDFYSRLKAYSFRCE